MDLWLNDIPFHHYHHHDPITNTMTMSQPSGIAVFYFRNHRILDYHCTFSQGWQFLPRGGFFHGKIWFLPSWKKYVSSISSNVLEETYLFQFSLNFSYR